MIRGLPKSAAAYLLLVIVAGCAALISQLVVWESDNAFRFLMYVTVFVVASCLKVWLPGITGNMSVNYVFVLLAILELTLPETIAMVAVGSVVQMFWQAEKRPTPEQLLFNVASLSLAVFCAHRAYYDPTLARWLQGQTVLLLAISATIYFLINTLSVAIIVGLTEAKSPLRIWRECYFWSFPYHLLGAALAVCLAAVNRYMGWQTTVLALPALFIVYKSYGLYLSRLEDEARHAREMASLHLRTIEALAAAIEAKDEGTHDHLERVQTYAVEMGAKLELRHEEIEAIRAASILHDIGKLAVPEHIISKPGKLTPEEFDKMKIHPVVGADILERVQFPYPVAPIVRHHHEKWNGSGYPTGLRGKEIPIGSRILSIVDCLDALASDRPYRRALPLDEAMEVVIGEGGKSYDPALVEILRANYREWEQMAKACSTGRDKVNTNIQVKLGKAPDAGFEQNLPPDEAPEGNEYDFVSHIAAARQEVQALYELSLDLGTSLSLEETMSVLDIRLRRLVPYNAISILTRVGDKLIPAYVNGDEAQFFGSLKIPVGEGLSGWVAESGKPIVNGNPTVEAGYLDDERRFSTLRSSLAVPLQHVGVTEGVLTLHHRSAGAFTSDHLRVLLAVAPKLAQSLKNAQSYQKAREGAATDGLTGLPNARSLFLRLNNEVERCARETTTLEVLVCDLDGFKRVNDRFGHLAGNEVLQLIAKGFQKTCRRYDYVARMGGDEFVVILPGPESEEYSTILRRLESVVVEAGIQVCSEDVLSASIGVAYYPEDGTDAEILLAAADRRMYQTKQVRKQLQIPSVETAETTNDIGLLTLLENVSNGTPPEPKPARRRTDAKQAK
jgi:diguanylate cyclase (GGDEF)-like protein/putative nucleotidyltransferase with HDIG domain